MNKIENNNEIINETKINENINQNNYEEPETIINNLNQVLEPGLIDLLETVEKKGYYAATKTEFNPLQYLAQYLMRNNPKYKYK